MERGGAPSFHLAGVPPGGGAAPPLRLVEVDRVSHLVGEQGKTAALRDHRFHENSMRASARATGQRGVSDCPCTVSSNPRSDFETVATGNDHTSASGAHCGSSG